VRPLLLSVKGEEDPLRAGDQATVTAGDAEETRILVGPAQDVAWTAGACSGPLGRTGPSASLLELRSY